MIKQILSFRPSSNWRQQRVRCGVSDEFIEEEECTLSVTCLQNGYVCKPEVLFGAVVAAIRRGEKERGWKPIIAPALGLDVLLITLPGDSVVMLGKQIIYTEVRSECRYNEARNLARDLADVLGTEMIDFDLLEPERWAEFRAEHDISIDEWRYPQVAAAVLGVCHE